MAATKLSEQEVHQHLAEVNSELEQGKQWQLTEGKLKTLSKRLVG